MSKGTASLLLLLAVITSLVVVTGGLLTVALGGADGSGGASAGSSIWFTLMHTISTGVLTKEEGTFAYLAVMTIVLNPHGRDKMTFSDRDDLILIADGSVD